MAKLVWSSRRYVVLKKGNETYRISYNSKDRSKALRAVLEMADSPECNLTRNDAAALAAYLAQDLCLPDQTTR